MGFKVDAWDLVTFAVLFLSVAAILLTVTFILSIPGRIAIARRHPDAEAVNLMGWLGFAAVIPWIQAFMWAFKPTDVIDIRRFPEEEQREIEETIARLKGGKSTKSPPSPKPKDESEG